MTEANWQFNDPPDVAVMVNKKIILEGDWIAYVSHDWDDGCWQFHTSQSEPVREEDAMVVSLKNIVERDLSINALSALPTGWCAWRDSQDDEWQTAAIQCL